MSEQPQELEQPPELEQPGPPEPAASERRNALTLRRGRLRPSRFPLHRLLVVARLREGAAAAAVTGYHRELFENMVEDHSGEQVSGLLLLYSTCIFHIVESCSSTIHHIIQDLASLKDQGHSALLQEIKVLVVAHNIPARLFPDWYVATATSPGTSPPDRTRSESTAEVVAGCLALLLKLTACIQSFEDNSEEPAESVHTLEPELLVPAETINYLCNAKECASPEDFLRMYSSPAQAALDSEMVWPVPSHFSA